MSTSHLRDDRFAGAFTAIVTPFTADGGEIDQASLEAQIARQAEGGITGIVVAGTTGESPTLSDAEYRTLVRHCVEVGKAHDLVVVAGTGSNSTAHAVELQRIALDLGADAGLSVNPYYNKPMQEGLYAHFATIADSVELPIMLYNIPGRTGVALAPATVERLYESPWVVSIKEATGSTDSATDILMRCPGIALLSGDDSMTLPFMALGGVGCVSVVGNIAPRPTAAVCKAMLEGDLPTARDLHRQLFALSRAMFIETNPICVKAALEIMHLDSGRLRLPMTPASEATRQALHDALESAGLLEPAAC
ncbi:MAG: 4-hydroxy-tetrahydrodipicolinate synthase [Phycisphaerales bacterium]